ncbi:hypothetical protein [Trinickia symbiotica]|uniref:hypothetical protein n=1 Tax=Trinickia symbiotica TaxID=863227 RepID=UPI002158D53E|nr:hypothetical protein [Trinickia symbiotica]
MTFAVNGEAAGADAEAGALAGVGGSTAAVVAGATLAALDEFALSAALTAPGLVLACANALAAYSEPRHRAAQLMAVPS